LGKGVGAPTLRRFESLENAPCHENLMMEKLGSLLDEIKNKHEMCGNRGMLTDTP
jgi:hypothetical protein